MTTARLAGFVSRACGLAVDGAILAVATVVVGAGIVLAGRVVGIHKSSGDAGVAVLAGCGWTVLVSVYLVTFWTIAGQTPGMRFMGLRVIDHRGGPVGRVQALRRLVGMFLAALPAGAGFLLILVDRRRRGLQDLVASTLVVHDPGALGRTAVASEAAPAAADGRERVELVHGDGRAALGGHA